MLFLVPPQKIRDVKQTGNVWPRISLAYLATYLLAKNYHTEIVDCRAEGIGFNQLRKRIGTLRPKIVGFSAFTEEMESVAKTCRIIKEIDSKTMTIVGGPHTSALPVQTLQEFPDIDIAVYGEGEETLLELAQLKDLSELRKVKGIAYRDNGNIFLNPGRRLIENIDSLPPPNWGLFNLKLYLGRETFSHSEKSGKKFLELPILGARGCPYSCNFCFRVFGSSIRFRNTKSIIDEIKWNVERYKASRFVFVEGSFGADEIWGIDLCNKLIENQLNKKIVWDANVRVDISRRLLLMMKRSGCERVYFGIESGDPEILKRSGKQISIPQAIRTVSYARKIGFTIGCYFIIGHPYETIKQANQTLKLAKKLAPEIFNLSIMVPFPGTEIYDLALEGKGGYKIISKDWNSYLKQDGGAIELEKISLKTLKKFQSRAYIRYYLSPKRIIFILKFFTWSKIIKIVRSLIKNI